MTAAMTPLPVPEPFFGLYRVGKLAHLEQLRQGRLRMRHLAHYAAEENALQPFHDPMEGLVAHFQADRINITFGPPGREILLNAKTGLVGQVPIWRSSGNPTLCFATLRPDGIEAGPVTTVTTEELAVSIRPPPGMDKFGEHAFVITDAQEFAKRVAAACKHKHITVRRGCVRYIDPQAFHGTIPRDAHGFVKRLQYSDEKEYRFVLDGHDLPDPFVLEVGSLDDITMVVALSDFRSGLRVELRKP